MKRIMAIVLVFSLCVGLCACFKSKEARNVEELIQAIGEVTIDSESAVLEARRSYDALTEEQKAEVKNYDVLVKAEEQFDQIALEVNIRAAYKEEKWGSVFTLTKVYIAKHPNTDFAPQAQKYNEEAIDVIDRKSIEHLKRGNLTDARLLLDAIKDDVDGAAELLAEVETYIAISGDYFATSYTREKGGKQLPYQSKRENFKLTVSPYMTDSGEWKAQYTVEVPGIFYLAGSKCFTYTCTGDAYGNGGNQTVAIELDPGIDYWNEKILESDAIEIISVDKGYKVVHTLFYANAPEYDEITLTFLNP